jgi:nitrite reductase (NADH) large subunit
MPGIPSNAWICGVCGYVHYGPEPPDECPVCGATQDMFEPSTEALPAQEMPNATQWRCLNCGYTHDGPKPPEACPVCEAAADLFEPCLPEAASQPQKSSSLKVLIVGAGIAGVSAAEALKKYAPGAEIRLISKENILPYYRLNLTRYLAGEVQAGQLPLHPENWYAERQIELMLGAELRSIDLAGKQVALRDGSQIEYDKLILTAGSHPYVPPFPGSNRENVTVLRTKADADEILNACHKDMHCVCIGGGLLGLETAGALALRGLQVTLLEGFGWLLPRQLNQRAGLLLEEYVRSKSISLRLNAQTQELVGDEQVCGVLLKDGSTLPADLVIISTGVRSNSYLARTAGIEVKNGVVVDNMLRTSHPDVFAAGDVAEHRGVVYGIWGPSQFQGSIAGMNVAGEKAEFAGVARSNMLKVLGIDMFSIGQIVLEDASYQAVEAEIDGRYYYYVFHDNYLVGSILLGDTALSAGVKNVIEKHIDCSKVLQKQPGVSEVLSFLGQVT